MSFRDNAVFGGANGSGSSEGKGLKGDLVGDLSGGGRVVRVDDVLAVEPLDAVERKVGL